MFGALFGLVVLTAIAAPLFASEVAHTTPSENHLTDRTVVDGESTDVVSLEGIPIGPTWRGSYLLGADENGRDLAVRLLYGARTTLVIGGGAVLLTLVLSIPLGLAAGYRGGRTDVIRRHVLRNGLIPPVNVGGLDLSHAFGGFVLYVEVIFGLPGVGGLTANTLASFDLPPTVALAIYLAIVVVFFSAIVDVVVAWLDPRLRQPAPST